MKVMSYITKYDATPVLYGISMEEIAAILLKKSSKNVQAATMISCGKTLKEVNEWDQGWMLMNLKRARDYQHFTMGLVLSSMLKPWSRPRTSSAKSSILIIVGKCEYSVYWYRPWQ